MSQTNRKARTPYEKKLFWRKARMYAVWALTFIACLIVSLSAFNRRFLEINDPQIKGAYVQIAKLLPTLETNEASLYGTYALLSQSREEAKKMDITLSADTLADSRSAQNIIEDNYIAERITRLAVGHEGLVTVVMKDTGKIVAHPNESEIGKTLMVSPIISSDIINTEGRTLATNVVNYKGIPDLDLSRFASESTARSVNLRRLILFSGDGDKVNLTSALSTMLFGSIVPYGDYYIVCGIDIWEYLLYMFRAVFISMIACAVLWLFVHYIALMLERHEQNGKDLRRQLIAYSLLLTVGIFCMSWYVQVLNSVTNDLNAIQDYADSGVATLKALQNTQKRVNSWFDEQYLIQCRIARDYVKSKGKENITRKDLADLSGKLGVRYIYVYDRNGRVLVTNSPYDHFRLSFDPEAPSNAFRPLLEGADHVIQEPMPDEISGTRCQLIGVSLRDADDLSDGFVQISINPELRDYLTQPLGLDSVLTDMTVGLPTAAFVVDKMAHTVTATTGFGYVGESMEDFGYTPDKLRANRNGFLKYGEKTYYAGFGEADDCYLVPVTERTTNTAAFMISVYIALVVLAGLALILLMALFHYQQSVVDAAPPPEELPEEPPVQKLLSLRESAMQLTGLSSLVRTRQKAGFDKRWHMKPAKSEQTPGERVKAIAYKMLLVFCVLNLLPLLYGSLSSNNRLSGLSYVLYGNWEKGVNIFAVSSCLFLLFVLYVFVLITSRLLYSIAKVSDMRMETICLLLRSSLKYVSVIIFIYYGLSQFGIPTQALLASAGIITLAISMGAKDMVNDIIAGFFILLEGNFKVGDFITVGTWSGIVQEIGLRTTRVNRFQETKILNNSSVKDIINSNEEAAHVTLELPVGSGASQDDIEKILKMELPELAIDVPGVVSVPVYEGMDSGTEGCMLLRFSFDVKNSNQLSASREMNSRLNQLFERYGIAVPDDTAGDAPKEA